MLRSTITLCCLVALLSACKKDESSAKDSPASKSADPAATPEADPAEQPAKPNEAAPATCPADAYRPPQIPTCIDLPDQLRPESPPKPYESSGWTVVEIKFDDFGESFLTLSYSPSADAEQEKELLMGFAESETKPTIRPIANDTGTFVSYSSGSMAVIPGTKGVVRCETEGDEEVAALCASVIAL